jgi:hypothetical protein
MNRSSFESDMALGLKILLDFSSPEMHEKRVRELLEQMSRAQESRAKVPVRL